MTSAGRALRGTCHCGRNQYIIRVPANASREAQILFSTDVDQRISSATPLSAFLRVPLAWYHSRTFAFFPDETRSTIRRIYSHPSEQHALRHFCGFCGTPLSYFTEEPRSEADYIQLTIGSLLTEDLYDLEELGLIPSDGEDDEVEDEGDRMDIVSAAPPTPAETQLLGRQFTNIPWFNTLIRGSRLGNIQTTRGVRESRDGTARVEWEIREWTADDDDDAEASGSSTTGKRKHGDTEQEEIVIGRGSATQ